MKKTLRIASLLIALTMLIPFSSDVKLIAGEIHAYAEGAATSDIKVPEDTTATETSEEVELTENAVPGFTFPEELRAATIVPGKDFFKDPTQSAETTQKEIDTIIENINSFEMNTLIIKTDYNDKAYFSSTDEATPEETAIRMLMEAAKKEYFFVYVDLNINFVLNQFEDTDLETRINFLTHIAHKFSREYISDGIILDGYYSKKTLENYDFYMDNGSGIGFENWLLENGAYVFSLVSNSIHMTDSSIPVGICISNAWANSSTNADGSATKDSFEALKDGFSDTVGYIQNGLTDFILLNTVGSMKDENLPFETVVKWWSEKAVGADIPLFVCHANEKIGTSENDWASPAQVLLQLTAMEKLPNYKGSAFNSYAGLLADSEATKALIKYYNGLIKADSLINELKMTTPSQTNTTFTTYEPSVIFQGTFDENFDVYFNDEPIKLNKAGNFYYEVPLKVGANQFKIRSKAKTIIYKITRKIDIIKEIEPKNSVSVEGGTTITVSAIAYKDDETTVTATLNGKTIKLTKLDGAWEGSDPNSSYAKYVGSFTTPDGKVGKEQNLGNIVIRGTYPNAENEAETGGSVIVNAIPENVDPTALIKITTDNAMTYDYGNTSSIPSPTNPRLPAGTLDYYTNLVNYSGVNYYLTQSGKRIKASDATVIDGYTFGENNLTVTNSFIDNTDTVIQMKMKTPIPFSIKYEPCNYYKSSGGAYYVDNFQATSVIVEFDYVTNVSSPPTIPAGSIFSSASWSTTTYNNRTRYQLKLNLAQAGIFAGVSAFYAQDGTLEMRFNGYKNSLSGTVIVIDPGHGVGAKTAGSFDPGAIGQVVEQQVNIAVAKKLRDKLQSQGATVYMLPTDTTMIQTVNRSSYARQYSPDMFISIHCNATTGSQSTRGTEAYYFTPFSQPLAKAVSSNVSSYFSNNVYSDGANKNRGDKWDYFYVTLQHDFPSILVELGFVTNMEDAMALANDSHQNGITDALVNGINQYLSR